MTAVPNAFSGLRRTLPLAAALALFLAVSASAVVQTLNAIGEPIYPIDDAYIHMAIARNLVEHGVYGITPFETTHASSSPLWVLLLAGGFALAGPWNLLPGLLAALAAIGAIIVADFYLRAQSDGGEEFPSLAGKAFVLCLMVAGASLPPLALLGMEHTLHAAGMLAATWLGAQAITRQGRHRQREVALVLLCCALPILRYESLWLVGLVGLGLAVRRRFGLAAAISLAATASVCLVGFWAMGKGLSFLPAPLLTKSVAPMLLSDNDAVRIAVKLTWHPLWRLSRVPMLAMLFISGTVYLGVVFWQWRWQAFERLSVAAVALFVGCTWSHATFATFGWGNRYEAYLIVLGTTTLGAVALDLRKRLDARLSWHKLAGLLAGFAAALTIYTAFGRAQRTYANTVQASREVLNRDFYIARFFAAAYPRESVLAMNIGAIVWEGEPRLLDPVALGTPEILPLLFARQLTPERIDALARERGVRVFAVFDEWFLQWTGGAPPWTRVAQIDASNDRRSLVLSLYAPNLAEARILAERLRAIRPAGRFTVKINVLPPFE